MTKDEHGGGFLPKSFVKIVKMLSESYDDGGKQKKRGLLEGIKVSEIFRFKNNLLVFCEYLVMNSKSKNIKELLKILEIP